MKFLFVFSFLINFISLKSKVNKSEFYDFIKFGFLLLLSSISFGLMISEETYLLWLIRENILIIAIMFIMLFLSSKIRFENILIYFIFTINVLHILQELIGYREPFFYQFLDLLLLPDTARDTTEYGAGAIGGLIYSYTGFYFNRINILFDQPSTYFIMITLFSFVLLFQKKHKFAFWFFVVGFSACPTKFGIAMVFLFLFFIRNRYNFSNKLQIFLILGAIFTVTYLPFIIGFLGNIIYDGNIILDYQSTIESRIYWTWLYGNGYMPWEVVERTGDFVYGVYDGIAAKVPFLIASIVAWIIAPKVRHFSAALILTVFLSIQYGVGMTLIWLFFVLSISMRELFRNRPIKT